MLQRPTWVDPARTETKMKKTWTLAAIGALAFASFGFAQAPAASVNPLVMKVNGDEVHAAEISLMMQNIQGFLLSQAFNAGLEAETESESIAVGARVRVRGRVESRGGGASPHRGRRGRSRAAPQTLRRHPIGGRAPPGSTATRPRT